MSGRSTAVSAAISGSCSASAPIRPPPCQPATAPSSTALGARVVAINAADADRSTLPLQCRDQTFLDWAKSHRLGGVLVRPDHFIAERLTAHAELRSLECLRQRGARAGHRVHNLRNGGITREALP